MLLPTTLSLAAAAAIINLWLMVRIGAIRRKAKILYGDGGDALLQRRMRAHANFIENAPLTLILIAGIEISGALSSAGGQVLAVIGAAFMLSRVLHVIGMDGGAAHRLRTIGALVTMLTQLALAAIAVLIALGRY